MQCNAMQCVYAHCNLQVLDLRGPGRVTCFPQLQQNKPYGRWKVSIRDRVAVVFDDFARLAPWEIRPDGLVRLSRLIRFSSRIDTVCVGSFCKRSFVVTFAPARDVEWKLADSVCV